MVTIRLLRIAFTIMSYTLQAVIAKSGTFSALLPPGLQIVPLRGGIDMLPLGSLACDVHGIPSLPLTDEGVEDPPQTLLELCRELSRGCPLACIEAEFFGGVGIQAHVLFAEGTVGRRSVSERAINEALRYLGVAKGGAWDEFAAVGLDRHRHTDDWIA